MNYDKGGRKKHFKNQATGEYGNTSRTVFHGMSDLRQLSKGITESHNNEENKLFTTKADINVLLESLIKNKETENET